LQGVRCGNRYLTHESFGAAAAIVWRGLDGREIERMPADLNASPTCAADGSVWYYSTVTPEPAVLRCAGSVCSKVTEGYFMAVMASPSGERLAVVNGRNNDFVIRWMRVHDHVLHELTTTETICRPTWSSENTIWVARQRRNGFVWVEFNVASGAETGRIVPKGSNCANGFFNEPAPVQGDTRVTSARASQWRRLRYASLPAW
jgi:hypothetical protein